VEKAAGQLFCQRSSKDILEMLLKECEQATLILEAGIEKVTQGSRWTIHSGKGTFTVESLVIASGGLSIPKMGASGFGYDIARQFGLPVLPTRAGLVPFTFTGAMQEMTSRLSGVSVPASIATDGVSFRDDLLFTHRGMSGPAALQISSFWEPGQSLDVALAPDIDFFSEFVDAQRSNPRAVLRTVLSGLLPRALTLDLEQQLFADEKDIPMIQIGQKTLRALADRLHHWVLKPAATEGYRTAEVTLGGVSTDALSSQTMACKSVDNLYFVGEVMDVTGQLGGFNFQWAWASGKAAGEVV
jgi:predicted Rossmann fold flavoprotein